jgi:hypothetical protein
MAEDVSIISNTLFYGEVLVSVGCYNMIAAVFGCPFPVTVFIGHSAIKATHT